MNSAKLNRLINLVRLNHTHTPASIWSTTILWIFVYTITSPNRFTDSKCCSVYRVNGISMQKPINAIKWLQLAVGRAPNNAITPEYVGPACTEQTCRITCIVRIMIIMISASALIAWSSNFGARGRLTERQLDTRLPSTDIDRYHFLLSIKYLFFSSILLLFAR